MNVKERVRQGQNVRVRPLAAEAGLSPSALYGLIAQNKLLATRVGRSLVVPAREAARLLGMEAA